MTEAPSIKEALEKALRTWENYERSMKDALLGTIMLLVFVYVAIWCVSQTVEEITWYGQNVIEK